MKVHQNTEPVSTIKFGIYNLSDQAVAEGNRQRSYKSMIHPWGDEGNDIYYKELLLPCM